MTNDDPSRHLQLLLSHLRRTDSSLDLVGADCDVRCGNVDGSSSSSGGGGGGGRSSSSSSSSSSSYFKVLADNSVDRTSFWKASWSRDRDT
eukprot:COSAG02_NODE_25767_length_649_cov_1.343636_1_plen_90_part_01